MKWLTVVGHKSWTRDVWWDSNQYAVKSLACVLHHSYYIVIYELSYFLYRMLDSQVWLLAVFNIPMMLKSRKFLVMIFYTIFWPRTFVSCCMWFPPVVPALFWQNSGEFSCCQEPWKVSAATRNSHVVFHTPPVDHSPFRVNIFVNNCSDCIWFLGNAWYTLWMSRGTA